MKTPKNSISDRWPQLVAAAESQVEQGTSAPYGFATRTVALWREARQNEVLRLWQRWSLRAGAAALAAGVALAVISASSGPATLIPVPEIELQLVS